MIDIQPHPDGAVLPVRAQAGARRPGLRGEQNGALKVALDMPEDFWQEFIEQQSEKA